MSRIKVLLCSPKGIPGGISQWTENILEYSKVDTDTVSLRWFYPNLETGNSVLQRSALDRISRGLRTYIPFVNNLRRLISAEHFDVAHFATSGSISFLRDYLVLRYCKKKGIKTVLHFHFGRLPQVLEHNGLERKLFDKLIRYTDNFVAIDNATYTALKNYGLQNVYNIPNPLAIRTQNLIDSTTEVSRDENVVLFVGHVLPSKGIYELAKACSEIESVHLKILGLYDEKTKNDILDSIPKAFHKSITFRGNCSFPEVIKEMKSCGTFVLPSYTEGFPNVIIESMACGCSIIATPVGAIPEMLDIAGRQCGYIVPVKDVETLKKAIVKAITSKETQKMAENAKERVSQLYSVDKVWNQLKWAWLK